MLYFIGGSLAMAGQPSNESWQMYKLFVLSVLLSVRNSPEDEEEQKNIDVIKYRIGVGCLFLCSAPKSYSVIRISVTRIILLTL
jgi:hypothetical protein